MHHLSRQQICWSLRCGWIIACRRCSNYIFILDLTADFNGLVKDNCKARREILKFWDLVRLILEIWWYVVNVTRYVWMKWQYQTQWGNIHSIIVMLPSCCAGSKKYSVNWLTVMCKRRQVVFIWRWNRTNNTYIGINVFKYTFIHTISDQLTLCHWIISIFSIKPIHRSNVPNRCHFRVMQRSGSIRHVG